jgi:nodulation protein E
MRLAIADAGVEATEIGYVNAHGTGTPINDHIEAEAIAAVFGAHAPHLLISSTKAVHGHAMGASGALEAMAVVLALVEGRVPPTAGLVEPDPALPRLDFVPGEARKVQVGAAMSSSFAFGGNNAVLVLRHL